MSLDHSSPDYCRSLQLSAGALMPDLNHIAGILKIQRISVIEDVCINLLVFLLKETYT